MRFARSLNRFPNFSFKKFKNRLSWFWHPTEKNLEMLRTIIATSSTEDSIVLDCFAGSATTLVAADQLNRSWVPAGLVGRRGALVHRRAVRATERIEAALLVYLTHWPLQPLDLQTASAFAGLLVAARGLPRDLRQWHRFRIAVRHDVHTGFLAASVSS